MRRDPFRVGLFYLRVTGGGADFRLLTPGYYLRPLRGQSDVLLVFSESPFVATARAAVLPSSGKYSNKIPAASPAPAGFRRRLTSIKMSEDKPNFKITDRRLFNPDGSPRDIEREEPAPPPTPAPSQEADAAPAPSSTATDSPAASGAGEEPARPAGDEDASTAARGPSASGAAESHGAAAADEDGQEFLMAVEFIASFAADALGMVNHPGAEGREVNPPLAKQCIDMLGALQRKTRGNLNEEEQHFLEVILSQLRMQYVSVTSAGRAGSPRGGGGRGFTGGDITGGM